MLLRQSKAPGNKLVGKSDNDLELKSNPSLAVDFIVATPRMSYYMDYSTRIYDIYLKYIAPEDMHIYSIDEVFIRLAKETYDLSRKKIS